MHFRGDTNYIAYYSVDMVILVLFMIMTMHEKKNTLNFSKRVYKWLVTVLVRRGASQGSLVASARVVV